MGLLLWLLMTAAVANRAATPQDIQAIRANVMDYPSGLRPGPYRLTSC